MSSSKDPVAIGQKLGKYRLTEKLGEGGIGMVFGGVHEALGREVAVKLLRAEFAKNPMVVARFQKEAEAVSRIGHSHIVAVYDFGRLADGTVYYVMERIRGETLGERIARPPAMSPPEIVGVFSQICRALNATHSRHIVHRDLKPDNVLLQPRERGIPHVKVLDFGVAKMRSSTGEGENITKIGMLLGTPTYMAPEQIRSSVNVDGRADLYSLGAMLYEVLTGQPPFGRGEVMVILTRHVRDPVVPPSQRLPPDSSLIIPPALDAMVMRSLAKNPDERQPDANTFIAELEVAWGITRPDVTGPHRIVIVPPEPPSRARRWWPIAAAGAALVLVGAMGMGVRWARARRLASTHSRVGAGGSAQAVAWHLIDDALASNNVVERRAALEALGEVGAVETVHRAAVDRIIAALADEEPEVRRAAATAALGVGRREDAGLVAALASAAAVSGGAAAVDVAAARQHLGVASAEEDLRGGLALHDPAQRLRAALALAEAGKLPTGLLRAALSSTAVAANYDGVRSPVRRSLRWAAYARLHQLGDPAFAAELEAALRGGAPAALLDAAQALARIPGPKQEGAARALARLAADTPDPLDRTDAAVALAELGDGRARLPLEAGLAEARAEVRAHAALGLARLAPFLGDSERADEVTRLVARLRPLLDDRDVTVRAAAAAAVLAIAGGSPVAAPSSSSSVPSLKPSPGRAP